MPGWSDIEGLHYADKVKKIRLIADDTLLIFKACPWGVEEVDRILREFSAQVGLKINYEKSVACVLGKSPTNYSTLFTRQYNWLEEGASFRYLGLHLGLNDEGQMVDRHNFANHRHILTEVLAQMRYAYVSLVGKILIIKTILASKFVYLFTLLPPTLKSSAVLIIISTPTCGTMVDRTLQPPLCRKMCTRGASMHSMFSCRKKASSLSGYSGYLRGLTPPCCGSITYMMPLLYLYTCYCS